MNLPSIKSLEADLPEPFVPERSYETESIEDALHACETDFCYTSSEVAINLLSLAEDLTLTVAGEPFRLTEPAFDDLCTLLKVPLHFVKKGVPRDLRAAIVDRLAREHQQLVIPVHRDGIVVGIVDPQRWTHSRARSETRRPRFEPVSNMQVLQMIHYIWTDLDTPPRIVIADSGLRVEMLTSPVTLEPQVGDVTRLGLVLTSSETGGPLPRARGFTLRLHCLNGAVLPEDFAQARFSSDRRVKFDSRLQSFAAQLQTLSLDEKRLEQAYARLCEERLTDLMFYNLWREIRYAYRFAPRNDLRADHILAVDMEARKAMITNVRKRQQALRDATGSTAANPPEATDLAIWDVFNDVTAAARHEPYQRRLALERVAGRLLHGFVPADMN